jgi:AraC family transcriptional regulator
MICEKHGVAVAHQQSWTDLGVEEIACEVRWLTEPGWLTLEAEVPTLYMAATEIGGRCEFRAKPDVPVDGEYFGSGALTFAARGSRIAIYATEMRQARVCSFSLRETEADYLTADDVDAVGRLRPRYMFQNERIRTCAALLDGARLRGDSPAFILPITKALFAAVLEMGYVMPKASRAASSKTAALTGASWGAIFKYVRDNLDEPVTVEALAAIAKMPPERFGKAFRDATGMSVRQWQMDHRVRCAQRLLTDDPNESLTEIATLCGFADQSHFSRAFLQVVGLTPTAWLHSRT